MKRKKVERIPIRIILEQLWWLNEQHKQFELEVHEMVSKNGILGNSNVELFIENFIEQLSSVSNQELLQFHGSPSNIVVEPTDHHEHISPFSGKKFNVEQNFGFLVFSSSRRLFQLSITSGSYSSV